MTITKQDWEEETGRVKRVVDHIQHELEQMEEVVSHYKTELIGANRNFWDDVDVNVETEDDMIETAASITQQSMMVAGHGRSLSHAEHALEKLKKQRLSPYFGRIDFTEEGETLNENIYVGISSVVDEQSGEHLVFDWRAPISSMFYDYGIGPAQYTPPAGTIHGSISLKRQYVFGQGQLENMFDTGLHIGDEMLQQMLGKNTDDKMRSIVTTIQREQNQIIRDDRHQALIVQGAAGSGKTSAALQRIAYLLYKYRKILNTDNVVLFSPNRMFNDYVSNVLPELGEANVQQSTFQEYVEHRLDLGMEVQDAYDQMEYLLSESDEVVYEHRIRTILYKASFDYVHMLENYAELLKTEGMIFKPFVVREKALISVEQLEELYYGTYGRFPIDERLEFIQEWILKELALIEEQYVRKAYRKLYFNPKYMGTKKEMKQMAEATVRKRFAPLEEITKRLLFIDVPGMYLRLFQDVSLAEKVAGEQGLPAEWNTVKEQTLRGWEMGAVPYEDAAPLLYFKEAIEGFDAFNQIRYVLVDEAQDYSPFQYAFLKKVFPRARMTFLGDLNQGIYAHTSSESYHSIRDLFGEEHTGVIRLTKSYRSTLQIVDFTRAILPDGEAIEAFSREGDKPLVVRASSNETLVRSVADRISEERAKGAHSIAIICKTAEESLAAFEKLKHLVEEVKHITKSTTRFVTGTIVIPSYLAKGLEFDSVILYNAGKAQYHRESERKLFYTACTRALHRLFVYHTGEQTPFIAEVDASFYETAIK